MKKLLFSLAAVFAAVAWLNAAPITLPKAQRVAEAFFAKTSLRSSAPIALSYTHSPSSGGLRAASLAAPAYYYVFNRGTNEGFVIVAGDDRLNEILAYSESGHFAFEKLPAQVAWWMGQYDAQIAALFAVNPSSESTPELRADRAAISPLLNVEGIVWDQGSPFNDLCPKGLNGKPAYSGCVATALAQIFRYYKWPEQAEGSITYQDRSVSRSMTFGKAPFQWELMIPNYKDKGTTAERAAVAQLLVEIGYSVKMFYGMDAQGSSGAYSQNISSALRNYFKYKHSVHLVRRSAMNREKWTELIYNELAAQRPVYYSGYTEGSSGHAFVCDGYNADGTFHFNWGWNGLANGYYRLDALRPQVLGAGAGMGDYSSAQEIVIGIAPARNGDNGARVYDNPEFAIRATLSEDKSTLSYRGTLYNSASDLFEAKTRIAIYKGAPEGTPFKTLNEDTALSMAIFEQNLASGNLSGAGWEDGRYSLCYEWKPVDSNGYRAFSTAIDEPNYLLFEVKGEKFSALSYDSPLEYLSVVEGTAKVEANAYDKARVSVEIKNEGTREYYGLMRVSAHGKTRSLFGLDPVATQVVTLPAGKTTSLSFEIARFNLPAGEDATISVYLPILDPNTPVSFNGFTAKRKTKEVEIAKLLVQAPNKYEHTTLVASTVLPEDTPARYNSAPPVFSSVSFDITNYGPRYNGGGQRYIVALFFYTSGVNVYKFISTNKMAKPIGTGQKEAYAPTFRKEDLEKASASPSSVIRIVSVIEQNGTLYLDSKNPVLGSYIREAKVYHDTSIAQKQEVLRPRCFPNPADLSTTVHYSGNVCSIDLFGADGVLLQRLIPMGTGMLTIDTSSLPEGNYFLGIRKEGDDVETLTLQVRH